MIFLQFLEKWLKSYYRKNKLFIAKIYMIEKKQVFYFEVFPKMKKFKSHPWTAKQITWV